MNFCSILFRKEYLVILSHKHDKTIGSVSSDYPLESMVKGFLRQDPIRYSNFCWISNVKLFS